MEYLILNITSKVNTENFNLNHRIILNIIHLMKSEIKLFTSFSYKYRQFC